MHHSHSSLSRLRFVCALAIFLTATSFPLQAKANGADKGQFTAARQDILDVISAYSYTYDSKDVVRWLDLFTKDAIWAWYGPNQNLVVQLNGTAEMKAFFEPRLIGLEQQGIQTRHYQTNTVFTEFKGNRAKTRTLILVTWQYAGEATPRPVHTGYYEDTFVRTKHGWKFKERVIFVDHD